MTTSATIHSFTDLKAWQESRKLVASVYAITKTFPASEMYGLISQMQRASVSISSNLAEGFSKTFKKEKLQFYSTALASLTEIQSQLLLSKDIGYITEKTYEEIAECTVLISKLINGLKKTVQSRSP